jgi:ATP-dependent RNA helicase DeaD
MQFSKLKLTEETQKALDLMKFLEMTPIQERAIPLLLAGKDLIGQAETGTGKTAAFAVPAIESIDINNQEIQILVLCPTRELCCQVADQFSQLMKFRAGLLCTPIYGGQKIEAQLKSIKNHPQVIVGTPGRLLDHVRRGSLRLRSTKIVILDEADQMLSMGFKDEIESLLNATKSRKQTILFSATMQPEILKLAKKHQKNAEHISLKKKEEAPKIKQSFFKVEPKKRPEAIKRLLSFHHINSALIFCNTKLQVDLLLKNLKEEGYSVEKLHGDLKQNRRDTVMRQFRDGETKILIATDIAARGIDVYDIEAVFNYNLPKESQDYVHRIGRTARAGKKGLAFSFVSSGEVQDIKKIASKHGFLINEEKVPAMRALEFASVMVLESTLLDSTLTKKTQKKYLKMIKEIQETAQDDAEVINKFIKTITQSKTNIFGNI